jgi:hypothetical protein
LVGGEWESGDPTPRSIHVDYWEHVCPPSERFEISSNDIKEGTRDGEGSERFRRAVQLIKEAPARCVEVTPSPTGGRPQVYDMDLIISPRSISLCEILLDSATSRLLRPSMVVNMAIERNIYAFTPQGALNVNASANVFERTLAVHVRRGDFDIYLCHNRADWAWTYYQW